MMQIPKSPHVPAPKYLAWIRTQLCSVSFQHGCIAHHLKFKGEGGTGFKVDDYLTMPLLPKYHDAQSKDGIHRGVKAWEAKHGTQIMFIRKMLNKAYDHAIINHDIWEKYTGILDDLEKKQ